ncbi:MAG TPA: cytochrome b/b6 domain-containing protein [Acidimicrobiales bacterium]|nr:cytochrome b/b6 domain-containing protein [Acidimicrobiales bacterium]
MTVATTTRRVARTMRFDRVQRAVHWANAGLFSALMFTAIPLYFGSFFGVVLPRHVIEQIHLWCGLTLPIPILISLIGPWGRQMRRDVRRVNAWTRDEIRWLRTRGASPLEADKFNPGQKLNTIFTGAVIVVMLVTGSMLQWFRFFSVSLRQGATFVHDLAAFAIFAVVIGHICVAITHRDSLRSIFRGWVSEQWAATHAPRWLREPRDVEGSVDRTATPRRRVE